MLNFCTLFNINFFSRGLALYQSLCKHEKNFRLFVFAFDDKTVSILQKLNYPNIIIIPLKDFEDNELLKVKPQRNISEYCWTCTSSTILYVLKNYSDIDSCTYLDADLYFYNSPKILLQEIPENKSVLITAHRYSPQYIKQLINGKYCVQFMTFKNNPEALDVLIWWREKCLEWCYSWYEDGKFGDQKYLDDWTVRFNSVHELQQPGGGLAPWNIQQYDIFKKNSCIFGKEIKTGISFQCIFYHFHGLKFFKSGKIQFSTKTYHIADTVINELYLPYIEELEKIKKEVLKVDKTVDPHGSTQWIAEIKKKIKREIFNTIKKI